MPVAAGSANLYFNRDTKVYLKQGVNIWEIPVLNGYSFNQSTNTSEVTLSEMADSQGNSRRGRKVFTDSFAPSEWSFDTYIRPQIASAVHRCVEEALWANFVAANAYTAGLPGAWSSSVDIGASDLEFNFSASNKVLLGTFDLYFVLGANVAADANYEADGDTLIYKLANCVINEATINFEVDGIAMISWSGMGGIRTEETSFDASSAIRVGVDSTNNFIRNRMTAMTLASSVSGSAVNYDITLTGGSITISNNITFLTPEVLGKVNQPIGHITGSRSVSGNFTCYLDEETNSSADLLEDISSALNAITNSFAMDIYIGGKAGGDAPVGPGMQIKMGQCHLELPQISTDDVISVDVNFSALPSNISGTDEITKVVYVGA